MAGVEAGRIAPVVPEGAVTFLIGMRIHRLWQLWKWLPVTVAMSRMLTELMKAPELGLRGRPRTFVSGRTVMVWQQWTSFDALEHYARAAEHEHMPAWSAFNKRSRGNSSVGIFHETYLLGPTTCEAMYVNMPPMGMAAAFGMQPADGSKRTARGRLAAPREGSAS